MLVSRDEGPERERRAEENRLQQVTENTGQVTTFKYGDGDTRVSKRGDGGETLYVNEWYTSGLGRSMKHVFAGTQRVASKQQNPPATGPGGQVEINQYFYHTDHLGTTSAVTDRVGQVWQNITYFPFGEEWVQEGTNNSTIPFRFTGKEFDEETRLSYYGARYYDPRTSVWQSTDPALGAYLSSGKPAFATPSYANNWHTRLLATGMGAAFEPRNLSVNAYAHQRPQNNIDPDGKVVLDKVLAGFAVDASVPEPTDAAWPKWAGWGAAIVVGAVAEAGIYVYNIGSDSADDVKPATSAIPATVADTAKKQTPLYRAVNDVELAAIIASGGRFTPSPFGSEGKYFAFNPQDAMKEGNAIWGKGNYTVVGTTYPGPVGPSFEDSTPEGRVPSVVIPNPELPKLSPAVPIARE